MNNKIYENWNKFLNEFWYSDVALEDGGAELPKNKKIKIKLNESWFGGEGVSEDGSNSEQKYFGNIITVATQIENIYDEFLQEVRNYYKKGPTDEITRDEVQVVINFFKDDVEKKTNGKAKSLGCGAFRCVFDIGDEYILKFDITPDGAARDQNKSDASVGTKPEFSDIFPKSVISGKDYRWVALERVIPFKKTNEDLKRYIQFFPNSEVNLTPYPEFHYYCVAISIVYHSGEQQLAEDKFQSIKKTFDNKMQNYPKDVTLDIIAKGFFTSNPFRRIIRVINEFGMRPEEIRLDNTGIASDGRFVIIDSSIEKDIRKGFGLPPKAKKIKPVTPGNAEATLKVT